MHAEDRIERAALAYHAVADVELVILDQRRVQLLPGQYAPHFRQPCVSFFHSQVSHVLAPSERAAKPFQYRELMPDSSRVELLPATLHYIAEPPS